jgi:hypothetical protein
VAEQLLASQEGLSSRKLVSYYVSMCAANHVSGSSSFLQCHCICYQLQVRPVTRSDREKTAAAFSRI